MELAPQFIVGQIVCTKITGYPRKQKGKRMAVVRYFGWNGDM